MERQRIVILGSSGFIGFHLAKFLESKMYNLVLIDNFVKNGNDKFYKLLTRNKSNVHLNLDLSLESSYFDLFDKDDIIVNCAALNGTQNFYNIPVNVIRNTAISAILAAEYASKSGVKKYIYLGSSESYAGGVNYGLVQLPTQENVPLIIDDPKNPRWSYAASKTIGEVSTLANIQQFKLNGVILRVHNVYGPRMGKFHVIPDLFEKFSKDDFRVIGSQETRSFLFVEDCVNIINYFITMKKKYIHPIINIGSEQEISIESLAQLILKNLSKNSSIKHVKSRPGSVSRRIPDISLLREMYKIEFTDIDSGLQIYHKWFESNKNNFL